MIIKDSKLIRAIQKEFNDKFPFLKIEFYEKKHAMGEGSERALKIDPGKIIAEVRSKHNTGDLSINGHLKVKTLEKHFADDYGLNVQVFRKSGDLWLQTIATDEWTLSEQNEHGSQSVTDSQGIINS
ncbi:MAG: hypothetical protein ACI8P3_000970 [Saprospiraceae bacterium]|jgi:hypothetical protein